jgi:hypothetical protein
MGNDGFKSYVIAIILVIVTFNSVEGQGVKKGAATIDAQKKSIATTDTKKVFKLPAHFNGVNAQMLRGPSWQTPGFIEQVQKLQPKLIRYPGGTVASYWDWKAGWLKDEIDIKKEWKTIRKSPILLEDLKFACDSTGAVPLFVLNMCTSTIAYQIEMLKKAQKLGLPVLYVELDNELYLGDEFYVSKFPTGIDYAKEANTWIAAIKSDFPKVKIGVVGHSSRESAAKKANNNSARIEMWNRDVLSVIKNADGMTFHVYGGTGLSYLGGKSTEDNTDEDANLDALQTIFETEGAIPIILGVPFQRWRNTNTYDYQILPSGMKAWITEYNLFEREGVMAGTWVHGLYALMKSMLFLENQNTELICYHNLTTSAQFAAIFNSDQGFAKAVKKKANQPFDFTASGYCLAMFGKALSENGIATKLKFSENTQLAGARGLLYPALNGWEIKTAKGSKIIVANLSSENIKTDFTKFFRKLATWSQVSSLPHTQVAGEQDVKMKSGNGMVVSLPAYSVTIIEGE